MIVPNLFNAALVHSYSIVKLGPSDRVPTEIAISFVKMETRHISLIAFALAAPLLTWAAGIFEEPTNDLVVVPLTSEHHRVLTPATLAIVVNKNDQESIVVGQYYARVRGIPSSNIIALDLPLSDSMDPEAFDHVLQKLAATPKSNDLLAFALAFGRPYRVGANQSITSAFAQGVSDFEWNGACNITADNPDKSLPAGAQLKTKPAMMLYGGGGIQSTINLINRGKAADATSPTGWILLEATGDQARSSPRETSMQAAAAEFPDLVAFSDERSRPPKSLKGLIAFQTGIARLSDLNAMTFLPGAYVDNLTSYGGALNDKKGQTTVSEIVQAGATASYGTVREPCNFKGKFPDAERMASRYLRGDSLIEAYWKSIDMTTEGLLIGEPLARPFPPIDADWTRNTLTFRVNKATLRLIKGIPQETRTRGSVSPANGTRTKLHVYSVESGVPVAVTDVTLTTNMKIGQIISTIPTRLDPKRAILGVLSR